MIFIASSIFYGWWDWRFLFLLYFTIGVDYFAARWIGATDDSRVRNRLLLVSLISNLGVLAFFKYFNFFIDSGVAVCQQFGLPVQAPALRIILPVGISFYTFQSLSYTIDVWRREMPPEPSLLNYATFATFFPQLVAGPIVRAELLVPQFQKDHEIRWESFVSGMQLVLWGLVMKCVVADSMALVVDNHFLYPERFSSLSLAAARCTRSASTATSPFADRDRFADLRRSLLSTARISLQRVLARWYISLSLAPRLPVHLAGRQPSRHLENLPQPDAHDGSAGSGTGELEFRDWEGSMARSSSFSAWRANLYGRVIEALRVPAWLVAMACGAYLPDLDLFQR